MNQPSKKISILISGNPQSNAGWSDIVMFNNANYKLEDTKYVGFSHLEKFYVVQIVESSVKGIKGEVDTSKVIYTLVMNNVKSFGASREGRLKISFSIPKGYRLPDRITPKLVMDEIEKFYVDNCMTANPDTGVKEFNEGLVDTHIMDEIGNKYPLIPCDAPFRPMNQQGATGYVETGDTAHLEVAMSDVQYEEFRNYKEVIFAESTSGTAYAKLSVDIPRRPNYVVYSNVKSRSGVESKTKTGIIVKNPEEEVTVPAPFSSEKYFKFQSVSFKLADLEKNPRSDIKVDKVNETITIDFLPEPVIRTFNFKIEPKGKVSADYLDTHQVSLVAKPQGVSLPIKVDDGKFTLSGNDIAYFDNNELSANIQQDKGYTIDKQLTCDPYSKTATLTIKVNAPEKKQRFEIGGDNGRKDLPSNTGSDEIAPLTIILEDSESVPDSTVIKVSLLERYEKLVMFRSSVRKELGKVIEENTEDLKQQNKDKLKTYDPQNEVRKGKHNKKQNKGKKGKHQEYEPVENGNPEEEKTIPMKWVIGVPTNLLRQSPFIKILTKEWNYTFNQIDPKNWPVTLTVPANMEDPGYVKVNPIVSHIKKSWSYYLNALLILAVILLGWLGDFSMGNKEGQNLTDPTIPTDPTEEFEETRISEEVPPVETVIIKDNMSPEELEREFGHIIDGIANNDFGDEIPLDSIDAFIHSRYMEMIESKYPEIIEHRKACEDIINSYKSSDQEAFGFLVDDYLKDSEKPQKFFLTQSQIDALKAKKDRLEQSRKKQREESERNKEMNSNAGSTPRPWWKPF